MGHAGVGPDSRVASAKADLLCRVLRPRATGYLLPVGTVSVIFSDIFTTIESVKAVIFTVTIISG